jgi:uncharacterized heparinase superfamily protein
MTKKGDGRLNQLLLLLRTARYLTPAQVWFRGRRIVKLRWRKLRGKRAPQPAGLRLATHAPLYVGLWDAVRGEELNDAIAAAIESAKAVAQNRFCFLNHAVHFETEPDWHSPRQSQLWRYHLHYFDYVRDLLIWAASGERSDAYSTFRRLADSWITRNQSLEGDGWQPYTISLRLVNWLNALSAFDAELTGDQPFRRRFLSSLHGQARILFSDLELDLRGNHLLENLRALLFAGVAFDGNEPKRWFQKASALLGRELAEQVLADGGHFERSPGYQLVVLKGVLEIGLWLRRNGHPPPSWLNDTLRRMLDYADAILPSDGCVPLLKDTAWDAAPEAEDLLAAGALYFDQPAYKRCRKPGLYPFLLFGLDGQERFERWPLNQTGRNSVGLTKSGHYVLRDEVNGEYLIFDAGKPCPDYLPAHAHADLLSYELMIDRQRIVVDSGVYEYAAGPWRDYFRSTRAHNTLEVEGEDQSEMWSSFRVARRARPGPVTWEQKDDYILAQASHDGYRRLPVPVTHRRTIVWRKNRFWLVVDELLGTGQTSADNHVHFHPDLSLESVDDLTWQIQGAGSSLWLGGFGQQSHSIVKGQIEPVRQGWFSERFGEIQANTVLTLHRQSRLPICWGYVISCHEPVRMQSNVADELKEITLTHAGSTFRLRLADGTSARFE